MFVLALAINVCGIQRKNRKLGEPEANSVIISCILLSYFKRRLTFIFILTLTKKVGDKDRNGNLGELKANSVRFT